MVPSAIVLLTLFCALMEWPTLISAFHRKPKGYNLLDESTWAPTMRLAEKFGYGAEAHKVRTPDGYLLTIHRISKAANRSEEQQHRTPVLMGHGLGGNSEEYVAQRHSTSFALVDAGFDVWLGNYRGSFYSRKHVTMSPKMPEFWDFSWHENGVIDEPAIIDYVLLTTGRPKLFLIGHSMGATAHAALLAAKPEYTREKVLCSVILAPQTFVENPGNDNLLTLVVGGVYGSVPVLKESIGRHVVNGPMPFFNNCLMPICFPNASADFANYCRSAVEAGFGKPHIPLTNVQVQNFLAHFPQGGSIRQFLHYAQSITSRGVFQQYDYGPVKNRQLYGSPNPPTYNFSDIVTPTYVFCGQVDHFPSLKDCLKLATKTPAVQGYYEVPYSHVEFILADDIDVYINKPIIDIFMKYIL